MAESASPQIEVRIGASKNSGPALSACLLSLRVADAMEETDLGLEVWVKQVREAAYDTADALDMYMLRLRHHHGNGVRRQEQGLRPTIAEYDSHGDALILEEAELWALKSPNGNCLSLVKKHFQNHGWITVSESFKIEDLLKSMIQQLFEEVKQPSPQGVENMDTTSLKAIINAFLKQKRYALVLDDVWDIHAWQSFRYAFPNGNYGSRVALLSDGPRLLTLLDLEGTQLETFPNEFAKLHHLKHLSLRSTNLKTIPKLIGNLQNLETLDLKQTHINELPDEILKLQRFRHLLLYRYDCKLGAFSFDNETGFKVPVGVGILSSLQKLCSIEVNHDNNSGIVLREVGKLTQLRRVHILKLRREDGKVLCSSLEKLKNLQSLLVNAIQEDEIIDLDSLSSPPQRLQTLYLIGHSQSLPKWIPFAFNLVRVCLTWSQLSGVNPLQSLQDLPNLAYLDLLQAYDGEELWFKAGAFQRLERLGLGQLKGLRWVRVEASSMPRLQKLFLMDFKLMEELPSGIEHLTNLQKLNLQDMSNSLISRLSRDLQGGKYWKVSHIPDIWIGEWKDGRWQGYSLF
ncbi:hypothetical protein Acr_26g0003670 [Actinidia rufa]|uniref:NB-ARC domain-containing disease resistance protein n=1 Tax=Actinidia rufa TaxID=165716 RepID=A0A7J0H1Y4_9ERIC|nr:hypothetical protein Acr_26g0003670 [Actinidia rufa]